MRMHCDTCRISSGEVTDIGAVGSFMASHALCSRVETTSTASLALAHAHLWLAVIETDDPTIVVRDCGCGARQRLRIDLAGNVEELPDGIVPGGSYANVVFRCAQGVPIRDRWHH